MARTPKRNSDTTVGQTSKARRGRKRDTEPAMERPPHSTLTDEQRSALIVLLALGVCGWALTAGLLTALERKKILTRRQGAKVVSQAVNGVQGLIDLGDHPVLQIAIAILTGKDEWEPPTE